MRRSAIFLAISLAALAVVPAGAQSTEPARVPYYLTTKSTFQEGCFDPCDCLLEQPRKVLGVFFLHPATSDPLFTYYDVTDIQWIVLPLGDPMRITGSGTYRVGGEVAIQHQLELDLQVGGGPIEHFDSGLLAGGGEFPEIHIPISIHGMVCYDMVIQVHARPAIQLAVNSSALTWNLLPGVLGFDVVRGDVRHLRETGGDFAAATRACLADDWNGNVLADPSAPPASGEAVWYLIRHVNPFFSGSYDDESPSLVATRDPGINAAPGSCP
jgi:hypothetical protein